MNEMRIYKIVMVAVLLGMASASLGGGDTWTQKADMPTARLALASSVVNGKIYAIGGRAEGNLTTEYDPATNTWTTKNRMPTSRFGLSTSVVDWKIYAIGGAPGLGSIFKIVEAYDPQTDTWTKKADMPTARIFLSTSVVDGKIYAIGGSAVTPWSTHFQNVEAYDPLTDTWTQKADMPTARAYLSTCVVDGKIYAIGGALASKTVLSTLEVYDPVTDTWTTKTPMPTARRGHATAVVDGIIYAIGGGTSTPSRGFSMVEAYDPATDTWTMKADMPAPRVFLSTGVVDGKIYAIGGSTAAIHPPGVRTVYEYEPIFILADFYRDGIVDIEDLLILIENWGQNEPSVDIAPLPFGDGVVDALDLEALMSYWGQKVQDVRAHWALDETEGDVAHDSIGNNDGTLHGEPLWQPSDGKFAGALELDGIDDYVSTDFILDPAKGSFSVFAWVKGGAPGQVIISQADSTMDNPLGQSNNPRITWLGANLSDGRLMTGLMDTFFGPLESESIITDGQWHHVGLVYDFDGLKRYLYVDGKEVAKDTDFAGGVGSDGGLYFGAGQYLEPASFFSGLIDDVRIYRRPLIAEDIRTLMQ